jgi:TetR/AcrR family transcriptional repressor of nem operon
VAGRPREFDEDEVLDKALGVFWEHGYSATSLSDLLESTGLAKGSLYKAFGDKRQLFVRALERYLERGRNSLDDLSRGGSPRAVLRKWLMNVVDMVTCAGVRKGCMAVNCTIELAPHDEELRGILRHQEKALERIYARLIAAGVEAGEFRTGLDPHAGARWLTTMVDGLQVRGKLGLTRNAALETVDMALDALQ